MQTTSAIKTATFILCTIMHTASPNGIVGTQYLSWLAFKGHMHAGAQKLTEYIQRLPGGNIITNHPLTTAFALTGTAIALQHLTARYYHQTERSWLVRFLSYALDKINPEQGPTGLKKKFDEFIENSSSALSEYEQLINTARGILETLNKFKHQKYQAPIVNYGPMTPKELAVELKKEFDAFSKKLQ